MAWRDIMGSILEASLRRVLSCIEGGDAEKCARYLLASADAIYAPLKPIDSGLGEARRIASLLAGIVSNSFLLEASGREGGEALIRDTLMVLEELRGRDSPVDEAKEILSDANVAGFEPAVSREARETIYSDLKNYVEPPQPPVPRRRRQPRRPDPRQAIRRALRELGRRDPVLAKQVSQILRRLGVA